MTLSTVPVDAAGIDNIRVTPLVRPQRRRG